MNLMRPATAVTLTAATALLLSGAPADAVIPLTPNTTFTGFNVNQDGTVTNPPSDGENIPNIDSVKSTLRAYYGATKGADPAYGLPNSTAPAQTYLPNLVDSAYAVNTETVADQILAALPDSPGTNDAVVFDVDSTLLSDYANEEDMFFNYNPALNGVWVSNHLFPAVPGMPALVRTLADEGYSVYGITGRPYNQEDDTITNLTEQGYTSDGTNSGTPLFDNDNLYTKWNTADANAKPSYIGACTLSPTCNTVEYKANTRKHIEQDLGDTIVMNVGDQWSDLEGGYAQDYTKVPNPSYYLPAADIAGAPTSDSSMVLPSTYTMAPDGSTGATATDGDALPNEGAVVRVIRAYYNAPTGIANKNDSPYVTQMKSIAATWADRLTTKCAKARRHHKVPAVVFDADDTTLMTYDMEDGAMKFNFDPTLQNTWVQEERFPATPGMQRVVRAAHRANCKIVGLTGRNNAQRTATLDNLAKYYFDKKTDQPLFRSQYYFTKWTSTDTPPAYVDPSVDGNPANYSTIDYKASTRKYVTERFGFKIVGNFGDQFSDLIGGYGRPVKLPNPTYYLP
jgi:predicted secreted acid phosphatase